jgi:hypothetical protein
MKKSDERQKQASKKKKQERREWRRRIMSTHIRKREHISAGRTHTHKHTHTHAHTISVYRGEQSSQRYFSGMFWLSSFMQATCCQTSHLSHETIKPSS